MSSKELIPEDITNILMEHNKLFNTIKTKNLNFRLHQLKKLKEGIIKYEPQITKL